MDCEWKKNFVKGKMLNLPSTYLTHQVGSLRILPSPGVPQTVGRCWQLLTYNSQKVLKVYQTLSLRVIYRILSMLRTVQKKKFLQEVDLYLPLKGLDLLSTKWEQKDQLREEATNPMMYTFLTTAHFLILPKSTCWQAGGSLEQA
jgi:hypothetical protein